MLQGRRLWKISLLIIILLALSAYGPYDFMGLYAKAKCVDSYYTEGQLIEASGKIYHKEIKKEQTIYYVRSALTKTSFLFKLNSDYIPLQSTIKLKGRVKPFLTARNEGAFDAKSYYNSIGLFFSIDDVEILEVKEGFFCFDIFYSLNKALSNVYTNCLPGEEAGFISSVAIGNRSMLETRLQELFQLAGLAHIIAVSGLHVSVICMAFYKLLRRLGQSYLVSGIAAASVAIMYGLLSGGSVSAIRAIGMFIIFLLAQITGQCYDMLTAAAVLGLILLADNPLYITNAGFLMSFGAIIGIYYIAIPLNRFFICYWKNRAQIRNVKNGLNQFAQEGIISKIQKAILSSLIFSFGINVAMYPLVVNTFYQVPTYSLFLNLLVLPLMPVVLCVGLVGGFVGLLWLGFGQAILMVCHFIIYYYEHLAFVCNQLPFSRVITGHKSMVFVIFYYILVLIVINCFLNGEYENISVSEICKRQRKRLFFSLGLLVFICLIFLSPGRGDFEIDFLDVGQGDGIYINSGDGYRFFIDGGSTSSDAVGKYTLEPFLKYKGAKTIDYWFISHTDLDHVSGLIELLESGYRVRNIVFTNCIPRDGNEAFAEITRLADATGTQVLFMRQGDVIGSRHIRFECVYPGGSVANLYSDDVNALSLSLLMSYDRNCDELPEYTAFFGGDLAAEQERIIASSGLVGHVDLLKVCHHGSRFSSDSAFLQTLSPDTAIISCAKHNLYGHPADEAVDRLGKAGARIYYTMNNGRVRVDGDGVDILLHD